MDGRLYTKLVSREGGYQLFHLESYVDVGFTKHRFHNGADFESMQEVLCHARLRNRFEIGPPICWM